MRLERVESLLKQQIAKILQEKIEDTRIGFVSITYVEVSKDLAYAKVFYSHLGSDKQREKTQEGLNSASRFIKGELGNRIRLQTIPDLRFVYDTSIAKGSDIINKLNSLK